MNATLSDFIYVSHNALTPEFCQHVIDKFEKDSRSTPGKVGTDERKRIDVTVKDSLDLHIGNKKDWEEEDQVFYESLASHIQPYTCNGKWIPDDRSIPMFRNMHDSGYQIQRTSPGGGYTWHHDEQFGSYVHDNGIRWATYIWYLNDVKEDGYTEFVNGTKIQPETGKIVIFPASWVYYHRGYPPKSETKYIVTGWMHAK